MFHFNWASPLWLGWIIYFLVVEAIALFNSRGGDTLSEHVWAWLGYRMGPGGTEAAYPRGSQRLRRFLTLAFLAWLVVHLLTGGMF
jgi:hypothetical protein